MLDYLEKMAQDEEARRCREEFYSKTLESFQSTNNERLWLKTNIKLAKLWLDQKDYTRLADKIRDLHKACQRPDGSDDPTKGTYSLEIYAIEILMYAEMRNNKRLKASALDTTLDRCSRWLTVYVALVPKSTQSQIRSSAPWSYWNN